jgi:hypothetical protein
MRKPLLAAAVSFLLASCDAHTSVMGVVKDLSGTPLEGALAELKPGGGGIVAHGTTSKDGSFHLGRTHGPGTGRFTLSISKAGYKPFGVEVDPAQKYACEISLTAVTEAAVSGGACQPTS